MLNTEGLIREYGDQAYHKAITFTVVATHLGDAESAEHFTACAQELMQRGYHKHEKREEETP